MICTYTLALAQGARFRRAVSPRGHIVDRSGGRAREGEQHTCDIYIYIYITCTYVGMYVCTYMYVHMCICMCVCIYIYIYE